MEEDESRYDMKRLVGKRLNEAEIQVIMLTVEKSKVKRERASLLINKGITLYFSFLLVAVIGLTYHFVDQMTFNILIFLGFGVLIFATVPYLQLMKTSEQDIDKMLDYIFQ